MQNWCTMFILWHATNVTSECCKLSQMFPVGTKKWMCLYHRYVVALQCRSNVIIYMHGQHYSKFTVIAIDAHSLPGWYLSFLTSLYSIRYKRLEEHHRIAVEIAFQTIYDFCILIWLFHKCKQSLCWNLFTFNINSIQFHQDNSNFNIFIYSIYRLQLKLLIEATVNVVASLSYKL